MTVFVSLLESRHGLMLMMAEENIKQSDADVAQICQCLKSTALYFTVTQDSDMCLLACAQRVFTLLRHTQSRHVCEKF